MEKCPLAFIGLGKCEGLSNCLLLEEQRGLGRNPDKIPEFLENLPPRVILHLALSLMPRFGLYRKCKNRAEIFRLALAELTSRGEDGDREN